MPWPPGRCRRGHESDLAAVAHDGEALAEPPGLSIAAVILSDDGDRLTGAPCSGQCGHVARKITLTMRFVIGHLQVDGDGLARSASAAYRGPLRSCVCFRCSMTASYPTERPVTAGPRTPCSPGSCRTRRGLEERSCANFRRSFLVPFVVDEAHGPESVEVGVPAGRTRRCPAPPGRRRLRRFWGSRRPNRSRAGIRQRFRSISARYCLLVLPDRRVFVTQQLDNRFVVRSAVPPSASRAHPVHAAGTDTALGSACPSRRPHHPRGSLRAADQARSAGQ